MKQHREVILKLIGATDFIDVDVLAGRTYYIYTPIRWGGAGFHGVHKGALVGEKAMVIGRSAALFIGDNSTVEI